MATIHELFFWALDKASITHALVPSWFLCTQLVIQGPYSLTLIAYKLETPYNTAHDKGCGSITCQGDNNPLVP